MTIIIGAGQAGLATAAALQDLGRASVLLEAHAAVGDVWRQRWVGLHLFTPARYSSLPGMRFPGDPYAFVDRLAFADYLSAFAKTRSLDVRCEQQVTALRQNEGGGFWVETQTGEQYQASAIVIAAGAFRTPHLPGFAERLPETLACIHTDQLRDVETWLPVGAKKLLVIGAGASGSQVAALARPHVGEVILAGRDTGNLPRHVLGRDVYDYLYGLGIMSLRVDRWPGRRLADVVSGDVTVGESLDHLCRRFDIQRVGRVEGFSDGIFQVADGLPIADIDAVVFATGYRNRYPFVQVPGALNEVGSPKHHHGISPVEGLYWMGLPYLRTISSALIGGVGADAAFVARTSGS